MRSPLLRSSGSNSSGQYLSKEDEKSLDTKGDRTHIRTNQNLLQNVAVHTAKQREITRKERVLEDAFSLMQAIWSGIRTRCEVLLEIGIWLIFLIPFAGVVGMICGLFLWGLQKVTEFRFENPWIIFICPLAGLACTASYHLLTMIPNRDSRSNHEVQGKDGYPEINLRTGPSIIGCSLLTHLVGGSAGQESAAIQAGTSVMQIFVYLAHWISWSRFGVEALEGTDVILMTGVAAGFAGAFGTPVAGAVFALEVHRVGYFASRALVPCLMAAMVADFCCRWILDLFETPHQVYTQMCNSGFCRQYDFVLTMQLLTMSFLAGLAGSLFAYAGHHFGAFYTHLTGPKYHFVWPLIAGPILVVSQYIFGTRDYYGLGVVSPDGENGVSLVTAFTKGTCFWYSWLVKLVLTVITLTAGFRGGEVTPLFFVGAVLGNWLGYWFDASQEEITIFAGCGFVAVFAAATRTPLAAAFMGIELFGSHYALYVFLSCTVAYAFSYNSSIYISQQASALRPTRFLTSRTEAIEHCTTCHQPALLPSIETDDMIDSWQQRPSFSDTGGVLSVLHRRESMLNLPTSHSPILGQVSVGQQPHIIDTRTVNSTVSPLPHRTEGGFLSDV